MQRSSTFYFNPQSSTLNTLVRTAAAHCPPCTNTMSTMQAQVREAGLQAAADVRGQEVPKDSPGIDKALDPNSDFPEKPVGSQEQQDATRDYLGPAASGQDMTNVDQMAEHPPVAGKRGEQDLKGDAVEGVNRSVGDFVGSVGDTEAGKKGTGGVDFSNAAGMGGL